jgi:hypothetical protein
MKFYLSAILILCFVTATNGQGKTSLGAEVGFPTGSGTDGVGTGFGGSLRYEAKAAKNLNWLVSAGYLHFPASLNSGGISVTGSFSFVPIAAGVKYYPSGNFDGFYFGTDFGLTVVSGKVTASYGGYSSTASDSQNKFAVSPGVGYHFGGFDLTFRYHLISDANYFGIRAAIVLNK